MDDDLLAQFAERYPLQRPRAELLGAAWNTTYRVTDSGGAPHVSWRQERKRSQRRDSPATGLVSWYSTAASGALVQTAGGGA